MISVSKLGHSYNSITLGHSWCYDVGHLIHVVRHLAREVGHLVHVVGHLALELSI